MTTGEEIGFGLILNVTFWISAIGGVSALGTWALVKYGPSARPMKPRARAAAETIGKSGAAGAAARPAEAGAQDPRRAA